MVERRECLKLTGATGLAVGLAGCTSYLPWVGGGDASDDGGGSGTDEPENNGGSETDDDQEQAGGGKEGEASSTQDENKEEQTDGQEEDQETEQEESEDMEQEQEQDPGPSEEETEIDRDQYEEQGEKSVTERSVSDVVIEATPTQADVGSVTVSGSVENVSETAIDMVDLEIIFYGTDDVHLGSELVTIEGLEAGASESFEATAHTEQLRGDVTRVHVEPMAYDIV